MPIKLFPPLKKEIRYWLNSGEYEERGIIVTQCPVCLRSTICPGDEPVTLRIYCHGSILMHNVDAYEAKANHALFNNSIHEPRKALRKRIRSIKELDK